MASAPWQSWAMDMRSIYRWENPQTTFKWLAIYIFLWYTEHLMGFLVSYQHLCIPHYILISNVVAIYHLPGVKKPLFPDIGRIAARIYAESP